MKHLDLFSGIGGFSLAARWLGMETVGFVEIDPWCRRVLAKNFPGVPQHDDIKTFQGDEFGPVDFITGGFPCQPFSTAGKRRGADDDRHLWPEMLRVIDRTRPTYVLGENVANFANMALDGVCADLEAIGYDVRAVVVPAVGVDARHRRHRTWIMAHDGSRRYGIEKGEVLAGRDTVISRSEDVAHTTGQRQQGPWTYRDARDSPAQGEGEAAQPVDGCIGHEWSPEPGVGRVASRIPNRVDRLKGLGNAIVPAVAYEIMCVMIEEQA